MKMLDKVKYDLSMNKLKVLRTVKVIEKNVKIRFCFLTNYNKPFGFRDKVPVIKTKISSW